MRFYRISIRIHSQPRKYKFELSQAFYLAWEHTPSKIQGASNRTVRVGVPMLTEVQKTQLQVRSLLVAAGGHSVRHNLQKIRGCGASASTQMGLLPGMLGLISLSLF